MAVVPYPMREGTLFVLRGIYESAGDSVLTYRHRRDSVSFLELGSVTVDHHGDVQTYIAPALIPIKADKHYRITALLDYTIVACVHHLEAGETHPPVYGKED